MTIAKGASDTRQFRRHTYFYNSAREGLRDFLASRPESSGTTVLLPAFVGWSAREGSGVFDPISDLGLNAEFYALNPDLTADIDDLSRRIEGRNLRALVLIQYFGRTDPSSAAVRALAERNNVPLVEDLAHGFFSAGCGGVAGSFGHVCLYSLHKMFPLRDGGMVSYEGERFANALSSDRGDLASEIFSYDWHAIARARRENYLKLAELLSDLRDRLGGFELVWPQLAIYDVPQSLPIYILNDSRDEIYELMNNAGYGVVSLYHTLIPQIDDGYDTSRWAAKHILNLPVHQDVRIESLTSLVNALEACLQSTGRGT